MFSLFKKKQPLPPAYLGGLYADMHSHLIPGIDDGAPDMETSLVLIRGMMALGYKKLITTPHIMGEIYPNHSDIILEGAEAVRKELEKENLDIAFSAAAEYMLDDNFSALLESDQPLLPIKDKMVLVEFSFVSPPLDYKQKIFAMQIKGYQPILAHPERYGYFHQNKKVYDDLLHMGCIFQVNLLSLTGYYGRPCMEVANYLLKKEAVSLLGADLHHQKHLAHLANPQLSEQVAAILQSHPMLNSQL